MLAGIEENVEETLRGKKCTMNQKSEQPSTMRLERALCQNHDRGVEKFSVKSNRLCCDALPWSSAVANIRFHNHQISALWSRMGDGALKKIRLHHSVHAMPAFPNSLGNARSPKSPMQCNVTNKCRSQTTARVYPVIHISWLRARG